MVLSGRTGNNFFELFSAPGSPAGPLGAGAPTSAPRGLENGRLGAAGPRKRLENGSLGATGARKQVPRGHWGSKKGRIGATGARATPRKVWFSYGKTYDLAKSPFSMFQAPS